MATPIRRYFANGAPAQTLISPITSGAIALGIVGSFTGWPVSFPFFAVIDRLTPSAEIVLVTAIVGTTASITRAQDGTVAVAHASGATFEQCVVQRDLDEANAHTNATAGVHGVVGAVVGTTDTQTMTNKTLTSPTLTSATMSGTTNTAALTATATVTGTALTASTGNIVATAGNITATAGNITATAGNVTAPAGAVLSPGLRTQLLWNSLDNLNNNSWTTLNSATLVGPTMQFDTLGANGAGSANGNLTIPTTGIYEISARVSTSNTTGTVGARVDVNGTTVSISLVAAVASTATVCSLPVQQHSLTAGDVVNLKAFSSIGSMTLFPSAGYTTFILLKRIS